MNSALDVPLQKLDISKLTEKQHDKLVQLCQDTIKKFLKDPDQGRDTVLDMIDQIDPNLELNEKQVDELMEACSSDLDECFRHDWDTTSRESLYDALEYELHMQSKVVSFAIKSQLSNNQLKYGDIINLDFNLDAEADDIHLDVICIDYCKGIYRDTVYNIILQEKGDKVFAKGVDIGEKKDGSKLRVLNIEELKFCQDKTIIIDDR